MKRTLLFLTNLGNGSEKEDIFLSNFLRKHFNVFVAHPVDALEWEGQFDLVLVRNVWPTYEYRQYKTGIIRKLVKNGRIGKSSVEAGYLKKPKYLEKEYILELFYKGFPVIPTVDRRSNLEQLGNTSEYFIKPKDRCDGIGTARISRQKLLCTNNITNCLIQPFLRFDYEVSFFFVDNRFIQAFQTPHRLKHRNFQIYKPSKNDLAFASKFVEWNDLPFGLQRIDAIREKRTGQLMLTEIEDFGPYLFILELPESYQNKIISAITQSLFRQLTRKRFTPKSS